MFVENFRLNKEFFQQLCSELRASTTLRGSKEIPLEVKVLCALSFLATGSYQRVVGLTQQLTQRTASRCIREVVAALNNDRVVGKWIIFPKTRQQRALIKQQFQRKYNLPGVIGCIDCTHVAIVKPVHEEHNFFNRKGYHSLNIQMICNHNLEIMNVNAKFGGATHDSYIWSTSQVESYMRSLHENGVHVWLLGDSGYPLRPWLLTPSIDAEPGSRAESYISRHIQARNCIVRCFGVLKSPWRCLLKHRVLHYHPVIASKIALACCVLHNMAIKARLPLPPDLHVELNDMTPDDLLPDGTAPSNAGSGSELIRGRAILNFVINSL